MEKRRVITVLEPQDEYTHTPDPAANYNESMYLNTFDLGGKWGLGSASATESTRDTPR